MPHISIVSPVYKAENIVDELVRRIKLSIAPITEDYEIILVDDCGPDNSWQKIYENARNDARVKGIKLSRNYGQHYAITAGLDACRGEWVVVMDCDLQDQPEEIINLYNEALKGYDIVFARRHNRADNWLKRMSSMFFYAFFSYLSGTKQDATIANFGIYSGKVIKAINGMREPMRAFAPMVKWVGFKRTAIDVAHSERYEGKSSYNFRKLINLAIDIAIAYSDRPLKLTIKFGLILSVTSFAYAIFVLIRYFFGAITVVGYTSLIISIWFLSGIVIFTLGIIGLYVGKTFEGVKNRPIYIIDLITNE